MNHRHDNHNKAQTGLLNTLWLLFPKLRLHVGAGPWQEPRSGEESDATVHVNKYARMSVALAQVQRMDSHDPEHPTPQAAGTEYFSLELEDVPAARLRPWGSRRASAARACPAAHCGALCRPCTCGSHGANSRFSCAADGGIAAGHHALLPVPEQQSCYRSAQDLARRCPCAHRCARYAAGGTAGGSADDRILFLAATEYGAECQHSSSWSWRANRWSSRFFLWTEFNSAAFVWNAFLSGLCGADR